jgi:hypothetical protein
MASLIALHAGMLGAESLQRARSSEGNLKKQAKTSMRRIAQLA